MNTVIKAAHHDMSEKTRQLVEAKLAPIARLLGKDGDTALLEVDLEHAPAEGRSATPTRLVANLTVAGRVFHAEAVKPSPKSAADRVRSELEAEVRRVRGKEQGLLRRGRSAIKHILRFGK